jgi:GR25 family glycosyltransferase involved in LPS biosynthesis
MTVHVINLKSRKDRLEHIKKVCDRESLRLSVHEATNGQQYYAKQFPNKRARGHAGCHHSHVTLLKKLRGTADYHVILEDDVELIEGFKDKVERLIYELSSDDWFMLYLGGNLNVYENPVERCDEHFNYAKKVMGTHAYVVNDAHIDDILEVITERVHKVDVMFMGLQQKVDVLISKECLAWQRETFSDIGFSVLNVNTKY